MSNTSTTNKNEVTKVHLQQLKDSNELKRTRVQQLADEYKHELERYRSLKYDDPSSSLSAPEKTGRTVFALVPSLNYQANALEVELSLSQENGVHVPKNTEELSSHGQGSLHASPSPPEIVTAWATITKQHSNILQQEYAQEIIGSYNDLEETVDTLEQVLERNQVKLQTKQAFVEEQELLFHSLQEQLQQLEKDLQKKSAGSNQNYDATNGIDSDSQQNQRAMEIQRENEWIRCELHYVSQLLSPPPPAKDNDKHNKPESRKRAQASSKSRSYNTKKRKQQEAEASSPTSYPTTNVLSGSSLKLPLIINEDCTVEHSVLALMKRLLDSPYDSYMPLQRRENTQTDDEIDTTARLRAHTSTSSVVQLLRECGAIRGHPDDENLISLTDYRL